MLFRSRLPIYITKRSVHTLFERVIHNPPKLQSSKSPNTLADMNYPGIFRAMQCTLPLNPDATKCNHYDLSSLTSASTSSDLVYLSVLPCCRSLWFKEVVQKPFISPPPCRSPGVVHSPNISSHPWPALRPGVYPVPLPPPSGSRPVTPDRSIPIPRPC